MKIDAWIFVGIAVLATVIGASEGWANQKCGPHEIYKDCGTACPETCQNHGKPRPCTKNCVQGCFCEDGFVREFFIDQGHKGQCVRLSECSKHPSCGRNETYKDCDSPCDDRCDCPNDTHETCPAGCFCKPGFVRNKNNKCIRKSDCHAKPSHCGQNEEYQECGTACPTTCANKHDVDRVCPAICVSGCFCKEGFIRKYKNATSTGPCILPEKCPKKPQICGKNEVYNNWPSPCDGTCDCPDNSGKICPKGCFCAPGFVRDKYGNCVCKDDCLSKCGKNEEYQQCGTACPKTCDNKDATGLACPAICVSGCFCKPPYIRKYKNATSTGPCILPEKCPKKPQICGKNEVYNNWPSPCDGTCDCPDNFGKICPKGCFCAPGFVRDKYGHCVCKDDCLSKCGKNEEYQQCGTACPKTCDDKDTTGLVCPAICVSGCFCKPPYIRKYKNGPCILPGECPNKPPICGKNEVYNNWPSLCDGTCDCPNKFGTICPKGCFCAPGFVRDKHGKCVCTTDCAPQCGKNEEHQTCGTACPKTCDNKDDLPSPCILLCVDGCFCKPPYIRKYKNATGTGPCILPSECPKKITCGLNEIYSDWPLPCDGTCDYPAGIKTCPKGCFCKPGFVRDKYGQCIPVNSCPLKPSQCGCNEEYNCCGTACPVTCQNMHQTGLACPQICVPGCFCTSGFVREYKNATGTGPCIRPTDCPKNCQQPGKCVPHEVHKKCGPHEVHKKCGPHEVYKKCGSACQETCGIKVNCIDKCVEGCFCQDGYVRDKVNGKCILRSKCPKIC